MNDIPLRDVPVIVVSNNDYEQSVIRQFLRQLRVGSVTMAENGVDALRCLREELEQILICRYAPNFTDGYRLCQFMKQRSGLFTHVRCRIIYSHDSSEQTISRLAGLDVDGFMLWPLSFNTFSKVIERPFRQEHKGGQQPPVARETIEDGNALDRSFFL